MATRASAGNQVKPQRPLVRILHGIFKDMIRRGGSHTNPTRKRGRSVIPPSLTRRVSVEDMSANF
jgi:hypothetical protein